MKAGPVPERVLLDFSDPTTGDWQIVNDAVMGGESTSNFQISNGAATFRGEVSLKNNGGFASASTLPTRFDQGEATEFVLCVRGDGRRYKFTARMGSSFGGWLYQSAFTTGKGEWQEVRLPLKDFVPTFRGRVLTGQPMLSTGKLTSFGFLISDRQSGPFQLEIAWIKASSGLG